MLPEALSCRASKEVPMIVVLPENSLGINGASFDQSRAVLVFADDDEAEETLTVLHEIAHVLDPGWEHEALKQAVKQDFARCPQSTRRLLGRVGHTPSEYFAELACWEIAGVPDLKHLPRAQKAVHEALYWRGN